MSFTLLAFTSPLSLPSSSHFRPVLTRTSLHSNVHLKPTLYPPFPPLPHLRQTPRSHGSHGAHPVTHPVTNTRSFPSSILTTIAPLRQDPRIAATSTLLFSVAALLHLLRILPNLSRISLYSGLTLAGFPILVVSAYRLITTPINAIDVEILMCLAGIALLITGAIFEAALLAVLYATSHAAEFAVQARARKALDELREAVPEHAWRMRVGGGVQHVPVAEIVVGDALLVRVGELVPCDGVVTEGSAFVSKQVLTGESVPNSVTVGDEVVAGARVEDSPVVVRVTQIGAESSLARIARLVTAAQGNRPAVQRFFDRFDKLYARSVLVISALVALLMPALSRVLAPLIKPVGFAGKSGSFIRALGFLVTASPCAFLIGAPVAYLAALSCCARRGVLAKSGAKSLEAASRVSHVVFDKTGTLTTGNLSLTSAAVLPGGNFSGNGVHTPTTGNGVSWKSHDGAFHLDGLEELEQVELSRIVSAAAALERGAVHPIAAAVRQRADQLGGELPFVSNSRVIAGQGVEGILSYDDVEGNLQITCGRMGRPSYVLGRKAFDAISKITEEASSRGETVSILEIGEERYLLRLRDEVRPESLEVVRDLEGQGLAVSVLTGDSKGAAEFVSNAMGGDVKVISNATPQEKLDYVNGLGKALSKTKTGVLMVGDGINDAAALAASLVGVSCGLSSATAVHAADVVLVREDLRNLGWFLRKARDTKSIVQQNLIIALGLMVIATTSCVAGAVPLWLAVTLHEGGTVLVGLNALRLLQ